MITPARRSAISTRAALVLAAALVACSACVVYVPVSSNVVGGVMLVGIVAADRTGPRPQLAPDRVIADVDCTRPLPENLTGNVRCKPPEAQ